MSCCSNRRAALTSLPQLRAAMPAPAGVQDTTGQPLTYSSQVDLALRGPFSGLVYRVGPDTRQIDADARDVAALLRTGQFSVGDVTLDIITLRHRFVS